MSVLCVGRSPSTNQDQFSNENYIKKSVFREVRANARAVAVNVARARADACATVRARAAAAEASRSSDGSSEPDLHWSDRDPCDGDW